MKKKIEINKKLINLLMSNGEKATSEKLLINSIKSLQKESKKQQKKLYQLALKNSIPVFKLHKSINKKQKKRNRVVRETPIFISNKSAREALALKFVLLNTKKKNLKNFNLKLKQEIIQTAKNKSISIDLKNDLQKKILLKKHFFNKYKQ